MSVKKEVTEHVLSMSKRGEVGSEDSPQTKRGPGRGVQDLAMKAAIRNARESLANADISIKYDCAPSIYETIRWLGLHGLNRFLDNSVKCKKLIFPACVCKKIINLESYNSDAAPQSKRHTTHTTEVSTGTKGLVTPTPTLRAALAATALPQERAAATVVSLTSSITRKSIGRAMATGSPRAPQDRPPSGGTDGWGPSGRNKHTNVQTYATRLWNLGIAVAPVLSKKSAILQ